MDRRHDRGPAQRRCHEVRGMEDVRPPDEQLGGEHTEVPQALDEPARDATVPPSGGTRQVGMGRPAGRERGDDHIGCVWTGEQRPQQLVGVAPDPRALTDQRHGIHGDAHHVRPTKRKPRQAARTAASTEARSAGSQTACRGAKCGFPYGSWRSSSPQRSRSSAARRSRPPPPECRTRSGTASRAASRRCGARMRAPAGSSRRRRTPRRTPRGARRARRTRRAAWRGMRR